MSSQAPALPAPVPVPAPAPPAASAALLPQAAATAPKRKRGRPPLQKSSSGIPSPKATVNLQQDSIACAADIGQSLSQLSDMSLLQQLDLLPTPILSQQQPTSKDPAADPAVSSKPRRVTHNVIEKRYRNNLNQRIADLRAAVPSLNLPAGAKKSANADASVANKEEDEGSDDDADAGAGGANGARMNKGTILLKATEYIRELEDNLNKTRSQMQQLQSLVVQKFGNDGEALIADFTASPEGLTTLNVGTPTSLSRAKSSSPSNKRTKIESKSSGEPNMLGSGIALHHQIQQWLTLQQQYQVAAAVAAAASVEAFKSLSASPPPTVHSNPSISPGIPPVSPDDHLGLLLANGPLGNSDTGMFLDGAEQSSQSMFNYLFDFGTDINDTTGANGARLLAMMFMSASVFYSPSPLVIVGKDSLHSHVLGRMLGTDNVNIESHVHFAGFKLDELSVFVAAGAWWLIKLSVIMFGISQILLGVFRLQSSRKASEVASSAQKNLHAVLSQNVFASSSLESVSSLGAFFEFIRFFICHVAGFGQVWSGGFFWGRQNNRLVWHATVARSCLRVLNEDLDYDYSPMQTVNTVFVSLSHASMAGSYINDCEIAKMKLSCALALRFAVCKRTPSFAMSNFLKVLSSWLWNDGLAILQDMEGEFDGTTLPFWLIQICKSEKLNAPHGFWNRETATARFADDAWILQMYSGDLSGMSNSEFGMLYEFGADAIPMHLLDAISNDPSAILATPSAFRKTTAGVVETVQPFLELFQSAQNECCAETRTGAAALLIMACWRQNFTVPASALAAASESGSKSDGHDVVRAALATCVLIRLGQFKRAAVAVGQLDAALSLLRQPAPAESTSNAAERCQQLRAAVEFAALSWVLETVACVGSGSRADVSDAMAAVSVKAVARMRRALPAVVAAKTGGLVSVDGRREHAKCLMAWMGVVNTL